MDYGQTFAWRSGLDTPGTANQIAIAGNLAVIADGCSGLRVHDISDPDHPLSLGSYNTPGQGYGVVVANGYAYVGGGWSALTRRALAACNPFGFFGIIVQPYDQFRRGSRQQQAGLHDQFR